MIAETIVLRVTQELFEQTLGVDTQATSFKIVEMLRCIDAEGRVNLLDRRRLRFSCRQVEANVVAYFVIGISLDHVPVVLVLGLLALLVEVHEHEVEDFVCLGEVEAG